MGFFWERSSLRGREKEIRQSECFIWQNKKRCGTEGCGYWDGYLHRDYPASTPLREWEKWTSASTDAHSNTQTPLDMIDEGWRSNTHINHCTHFQTTWLGRFGGLTWVPCDSSDWLGDRGKRSWISQPPEGAIQHQIPWEQYDRWLTHTMLHPLRNKRQNHILYVCQTVFKCYGI